MLNTFLRDGIPELSSELEHVFGAAIEMPLASCAQVADGGGYISLGFGELVDDKTRYEEQILVSAMIVYGQYGIHPGFDVRWIGTDDITMTGNQTIEGLASLRGRFLKGVAKRYADDYTGAGIELYFEVSGPETVPGTTGALLKLWPVIRQDPIDGSLLPIMRYDTGLWQIPIK